MRLILYAEKNKPPDQRIKVEGLYIKITFSTFTHAVNLYYQNYNLII